MISAQASHFTDSLPTQSVMHLNHIGTVRCHHWSRQDRRPAGRCSTGDWLHDEYCAAPEIHVIATRRLWGNAFIKSNSGSCLVVIGLMLCVWTVSASPCVDEANQVVLGSDQDCVGLLNAKGESHMAFVVAAKCGGPPFLSDSVEAINRAFRSPCWRWSTMLPMEAARV